MKDFRLKACQGIWCVYIQQSWAQKRSRQCSNLKSWRFSQDFHKIFDRWLNHPSIEHSVVLESLIFKVVMYAGLFEDWTPHRTHHSAPQTRFFSCRAHLVIQCTCVGSRASRLKWVAFFCPRHSQKSFLRLMSHRNLLGLPDNLPRFSEVLVTELGGNCADPRNGSWFDRIAERSPLTLFLGPLQSLKTFWKNIFAK